MTRHAAALALTVTLLAGCSSTGNPSQTIADACAGLAVAQGAVAVYLAQRPTEAKVHIVASSVALVAGPACTAPYPSTDAGAIAAVESGTAQLLAALAANP